MEAYGVGRSAYQDVDIRPSKKIGKKMLIGVYDHVQKQERRIILGGVLVKIAITHRAKPIVK